MELPRELLVAYLRVEFFVMMEVQTPFPMIFQSHPRKIKAGSRQSEEGDNWANAFKVLLNELNKFRGRSLQQEAFVGNFIKYKSKLLSEVIYSF